MKAKMLKVKKIEYLPNPGSDVALDRGCLCPVLDNGHGHGAQGLRNGQFWINEDCPLHGSKK